MLIHYIDDDPNDAKLLSRLIEADSSFHLSYDSSIDALPRRIQESPVDCILIDVWRPDSKSIEEDVNRIRDVTRAPIVFITGSETNEIRIRAAKAGAEAVLDKNQITTDTLRQIFYAANAKYIAENAQQVLEASDSSLPNFNLARLDAPLAYLEYGLSTLIDIMRDNGQSVSTSFVTHLFQTIRAMRAFAVSDLKTQAQAPVHEMMLRMRNHIVDLSMVKKVELAMDIERSWYSQIGPEMIAQLGLQHLVEGILRTCESGNKIHLRVEKADTGIAIVISLEQPTFKDAKMIFGPALENDPIGLDARSSLHLGAMLLNLRPEQIFIDTHATGQRLCLNL